MSAGLSVVIPAFDEAEHLGANLRRLVLSLEESGRRFEVLVVDDGSRDATRSEAQHVAAVDARVRVLHHARNEGKGRALTTGCAAAREDILVLLDADLEIPPEDILPLVARMEAAHADVAVGSKYHPEASLVWPLYRRALSRFYQTVTRILFRLPLRDTQTGLKAIRRDVAIPLLPRLHARRFAWDLELLLFAHRAGHAFVTGPVHVRPASRASRVGWGGALQAGIDTLRIFARDRAGAGRGLRPRSARPTRVLVSGDDLGMSASVDAGLLRGLAAGGLRSVSALADGPTLCEALATVAQQTHRADIGLHLDLLQGRSTLRLMWRSACDAFSGKDSASEFRRQSARLRDAGIEVSHVDTHRHAWVLPWVRRDACRASHAEGIGAVRSLRPLGPLWGSGWVEAAKRLVFLGGATLSAGVARAHGLREPDGFVDAREAVRWVRAGRLPAFVRGRTVEVIAHPALGPADWPASEQGQLDRAAEARAVLEPPLAHALAALGADIIDFRGLARTPMSGGEPTCRSQHYKSAYRN
jgi:predicted glycoside hydrolase/deacetylase ChbG (UPF0249 family)